MSISKIRTSDGAEHRIDYEGLENKPATIPGYFAINTEIPGTQTIEIDASEHLPKDGNPYLLSIQGFSGGAGSGFIALWIHTDLMPEPGSYTLGRCNLPQYMAQQCEILIGPERKIYIWNSGNVSTGKVGIKLLHYRRA